MRLGEYFLPQFPTGDMSTEDYLVKRAKEGLEERLAFLFPDEEERLKRRPNMTNVWRLNFRLSTRWASGLLPHRYGIYPVVER